MVRLASVGLGLLFAAAVFAADPRPAEALRRFGSGKFSGGPFALAAFSHDGKLVFTVKSRPGSNPPPDAFGLTAWDVESGRMRWTAGDGIVLAMRGAEDGKSVFVVTAKSLRSDTPLRFHRLALADGKALVDRAASEEIANSHSPTVAADGWVTFVEWSDKEPVMKAVVLNGEGKVVLRYKAAADGGFERVLLGPDHTFAVVTAYPNDQFGGGIGTTARLFAVSVKTGKELWSRDVLSSDAVLSPDGKHVFTISPGVTRPATPPVLRRHDAATGKVEASAELRGADGVGWRNKRLLAVCPDGKAVFVRGGDGETLVVNAKSLRVESRSDAGLFEGCFSPDGKTAASLGGLNLTLHDLPSGRLRADSAPPLPKAQWPRYHFSKDGKTVTRVGGDTAISWDVATGRESARVLPAKLLAEGLPGITVVADKYPKKLAARSPDGKAALTYSNPTVQQMAFKLKLEVNGKEWPDTGLEERMVGVLQLDFTPDGRYALAQLDQEHLHVWDLKAAPSSGNAITFATPGPSGYRQVPLVHVAPDGKRVALVEADPKAPIVAAAAVARYQWRLGVYDLATRNRQAGLSGTGFLTAVDWSADARFVAGAGRRSESEGFVFVAAANGKYLMRPTDLPKPATACALSADNRTLAVGVGGEVHSYEVRSGRLRQVFKPEAGNVLAFRFHPADGSLLSESADGAVFQWDVRGTLATHPVPDVAALTRLWADLKADDAAKAFQAVRHLAKHPAVVLPFLSGKVAGQKRPLAQDIQTRVGRLTSRDFTEREKAEKELRAMGRIAWPALKAAVGIDSSPELRARATRLLAVTNGPIGLRTAR